jgi:hypothetical protein
MMTTYNKGKSMRFTVYQNVDVEVETDFSLKEVFEAISNDTEALETFKEMFIATGIFSASYQHGDASDFSQALDYLQERSFEVSNEDKEQVVTLAQKYRFLPVHAW